VVKRRRGRPPKALQATSETRAALLRSGLALLTEKGYSATGLEEILRREGVPKGSFYHYFDSKQAFGLALIDEYQRFFCHRLDKCLTATEMEPLQRLAAFVELSEQGMARYQFRRGCLIGNLGQELTALPEDFRQRLCEAMQQWQQRLANCLEEAQQVGQIAPEQDCQQLAYLFWTGWEGAVLRAKLEQNGRALQDFGLFFIRSITA